MFCVRDWVNLCSALGGWVNPMVVALRDWVNPMVCVRGLG